MLRKGKTNKQMPGKCVSKVCLDRQTGSDLQVIAKDQKLTAKLLFNMCILHPFVNDATHCH